MNTLLGSGLLAAAGIGAGLVNALAGGGTLLTFPALCALGLAPVIANVSSAVALVPGYLGATVAQRADLGGQGRRLRWLLPAAALGGVAGAWLLLAGPERLFGRLMPYLIFSAVLLLALPGRLRRWLQRPAAMTEYGTDLMGLAVPGIALAAVYGGYFGAGLSVIVLALLGVTQHDSLTRLNAAKQVIAFVANLTAALSFVLSGRVAWRATLVVAVGAWIGGWLGGRLAGRVPAESLRLGVVIVGTLIGCIYLWR